MLEKRVCWKLVTKISRSTPSSFPGLIGCLRCHKDFTNAQAFFVSACEQATSGKIKLVN